MKKGDKVVITGGFPEEFHGRTGEVIAIRKNMDFAFVQFPGDNTKHEFAVSDLTPLYLQETTQPLFPEYREFLDLTDEEITYIIKDIFPTKKVENITRDTKWNRISCDIYIMDEYPNIPDTLDLDLTEITTHDFNLTYDQLLRWKQYLLAKGCDYRLKDNPYIAIVQNTIEMSSEDLERD